LRGEDLESLSIDEFLASRHALSIFNGFQKHWLEELEELNNANFTYSSHGINFDPAAAVHRQAEFALKMSHFGWLYSLTLASTLERSVVRYQRFFALIAEHPGHLLVPTLDVDLVWHTHQLSPAKYALYCKATTSGRFINHDDRVEKDKLKSGFDQTQSFYRELSGEEYEGCHSWLCEAARTAAEAGVPFSGPKISAVKALITQEKMRKAKLGLPVMLEHAACHCLCEKLSPAGRDADQAVKSVSMEDESTVRCICGDLIPRSTDALDGPSDCDESCRRKRCGGSCTSCNGNCSTSCSSDCSGGCGGG
jgi:Glycine-rich domain-containing protein-like